MATKKEPKQIKCYCGHTTYCDCVPLEEPKQETHICKWCKAETWQSDDECYAKQEIETTPNKTNMKQQTAVEWLYNNLKSHFEHDGDLLEVVQFSFQQAKEMEKEQMGYIGIEISDKVLFEQATVAMEEWYGYGCETEIDAYFRGLKWMQSQFKKKQQ